MRTYGRLWFDEKSKNWIVKAEPHITIRMKRVFERISKTEFGQITLADSDETRRELDWFLQRYNLEVADKDWTRILDGTERYKEEILTLEKIIDPNWKPRREIKMALPPRQYQLQAAEVLLERKFLLLGDDLGLGKAQPLDAKVLTPAGWVKIGSLVVGQEVIDPDGGVAQVTGVFPQGEKDIYRLTMADGAATECCDDHLWLIKNPNDRRRGTDRLLALKEFKSQVYKKYSGQHASQIFLPICMPPKFNKKQKLELPPYLLGALLGDGGFKKNSITFTNADEGVLSNVRKLLRNGMELRYQGSGYDYRVTRGNVGHRIANEVVWAIRILGLSNKRSHEKFIPEKYLFSSVEDRKDILRGLMDTDGACRKDSWVSFTTTSENLSKDVEWLVRSLGGFVSRSSRITHYTYLGEKKAGRLSHTLGIRVPFNPFSCEKRAARWRPPNMAWAVKSVVSVGKKEAVCISVSSKRNLYVTDDFIVTHNTVSTITCFTEPRTLPAVVVTLAGVLPIQWQEEVNRFMPSLFTHIIKKRALYELPKRDGRGPDVLIINYAKLDSWAEILAKYVNCITFDEGQELRHKGTAKYDAAVHVARHSKYALALSGTPIFNYGGEIYNVLNVLKDGALGKYDEFFREWCTSAYGEKKISVRDPKALGTYLRENFLMLRRTRKDVGRELPPLSKIPHTVAVDMKALDGVKDSAFALAKLITSEQKLSGFEKMKASEELSHMLRQATGVAKSPYVADFVRMLVEEGSSVVVYAWHRTVYDIMAKKLEDLNPVMITGAESTKEKITSKKKFISGESKVLMISLRAGAGIDGLQKVSNTVVFAELDWSPGAMEQCLGRVFRDGQPQPVTAFYLVTEEGSDPTMSQALGLKTEQIEGLRNPDKELVETLQVDEERIRTLAKNYLAKNRAKMEADGEEEKEGEEEEVEEEPKEAESEA